MITEDDIRKLGELRWAVPLLAMLRAGGGARYAEMAFALAIPKDSLGRTLDHLIAAGWLCRNAGHGHPLRPEYVLTVNGVPIAASCASIMAARQKLGIGHHALPRWSLPLLWRIDRRRVGFADLRRELAPITSRALSLTLQQMIAGCLVSRCVEDSFPPATTYGLAAPGLALRRSIMSREKASSTS